MQYSVITSRRAQNALDKIRADHVDLLTGMRDQSLRVQQYDQQKSLEARENTAKSMEWNKSVIDAGQKQQDLDIKRMSATTP